MQFITLCYSHINCLCNKQEDVLFSLLLLEFTRTCQNKNRFFLISSLFFLMTNRINIRSR